MSELATRSTSLKECLSADGWQPEGWLCHSDSSLIALQKQGFNQFLKQGLPTKKENWKYTRTQHLAATSFICSDGESGSVNQMRQTTMVDSYSVVFIDGVWSSNCSKLHGLPEGVVVCPLSQALKQHPGLVKQALKDALQDSLSVPANERQAHPFRVLNAGLLTEGLFFYIPKQVQLNKPVHFLFIHKEKESLMHHPRHIMLLAEGARASVLEEHVSEEAGCYFTNRVLNVVLDKYAHCHYVNIQQDDCSAFQVSSTLVDVAEHATWQHLSVSLGAKLARDDIHVKLIGEHASCHLLGAAKLQGNGQHVDHQITVDHLASNTTSCQHYRAIVDNTAHAVFNGRIMVSEQVGGIKANQTHHTVLLSDRAVVDTKPELEIYAQDVECSHGVTVGCLDEAALFYLQSRGIAQDVAQTMLLQSVLQRVLADMPVETMAERAVMNKVNDVLLACEHWSAV